MIIHRNMKKMSLEKYYNVQSPSGQWKYEWIKARDVDVAIYPANNVILTSNNQRYAECTNTGLSTDKNIVDTGKHRLNDNGQIYEIRFSNPVGKYTQLFLRIVVQDG